MSHNQFMSHLDELDALSATAPILSSLVAGRQRNRPAGDEGWTVVEIVAHLRDAERFRLERCTKMANELEPFLEAFDQEVLASHRDYASTDLADELSHFLALRAGVIELLELLDDAGWRRIGRHEELGRITIEEHIRHAISHDLVHLRQIVESFS
jgi:hypothetical protein